MILGVLAIGVSIATVSACVGDDPSAAPSSDDGGGDASSDGIAPSDGNTPTDGETPDGSARTAVEVAAGFNHSCALLSDGTVWCWGADDFGQLGVSSVSLATNSACNGPCDSTAHQIEFPAGVQIAQIAADNHSCAVAKNGDVYCWGRNESGELGHAPNATGAGDVPCAPTGTICNITPQKVAGIADVVKVDVGDKETCAITAGHAVYCWGSNEAFLLGQPGDTDAAVISPTPIAVTTLAGKTITDIAIARNGAHACVISQGEGMWCWGFNNEGQLGHAVGQGSPVDISSGILGLAGNATPQLQGGTSYAVHVAVAQGVSCGSADGGTAGCWGDNDTGQFGNGTVGVLNVYVPLTVAGGDASDIVDISGGGTSNSTVFCTIGSASRLSCWGVTDYGQVGNGTFNQVDAGATFDAGPLCNGVHCADTPQLLPVAVKSVSIGVAVAAAIGTDGKIYTWGANDYGQLGHAPYTAGDNHACGTGVPGDRVGACNPIPGVVSGLP